MMNVVLVAPEIPQNTGNIARSVLSVFGKLHLVEPLGFSLDDKYLKRAGLDYWHDVDIVRWSTLEKLLDHIASHNQTAWFLTTRSENPYDIVDYKDGDWLIFGSESRGLSPVVLDRYAEKTVTIPLPNLAVRSLNLASAVATVLFAAESKVRVFND